MKATKNNNNHDTLFLKILIWLKIVLIQKKYYAGGKVIRTVRKINQYNPLVYIVTVLSIPFVFTIGGCISVHNNLTELKEDFKWS